MHCLVLINLIENYGLSFLHHMILREHNGVSSGLGTREYFLSLCQAFQALFHSVMIYWGSLFTRALSPHHHWTGGRERHQTWQSEQRSSLGMPNGKWQIGQFFYCGENNPTWRSSSISYQRAEMGYGYGITRL
jgi:hypothetical protein